MGNNKILDQLGIPKQKIGETGGQRGQGDRLFLSSSRPEKKDCPRVSLTATYRDILYYLTVVEGTGSGSYAAGTIIPVDINAHPSGDFVEWQYDTEYLADKTQAATTFTMPAANAVIAPKFTDDSGSGLFSLIVISGTGSGRYAAGDSVTITATVPEGSAFIQWSGMTAPFANETDQASVTFTMPARDISVRAITDEPVRIDIETGWNLVSVTRETFTPSSMLEYSDLIPGTIWSWGNNRYFSADAPTPQDPNATIPTWHRQGYLIPGHGYWLYATQPATILLP